MKALVFSLLLALSAVHAQAQLVLNIDVDNEEFWLSGSGNVNVGDPLLQNVIFGGFNLDGGPVDDRFVSFNNDLTFTTSVGNPGNAFTSYDTEVSVDTSNDNVTEFQIAFAVSNSGAQTLTGLENPLSYAGLFDGNTGDGAALMNSLIALGSLPTLNGEPGTQDLLVVAVPEPSSVALITLGGLAVLLGRRRR